MKIWISFLLCLSRITVDVHAQKNVPAYMDSILQEIKRTNVCEMTVTLGFAGTPSQQNVRLKLLAEHASTAELMDRFYVEDHPVALYYIWKALQIKMVVIPDNIIQKLSKDNRIVTVLEGCNRTEKALSKLIPLK